MKRCLLIFAGMLGGALCAIGQMNVPTASLTVRVFDESAVPIKVAQVSIWSQDTMKELQRTGGVNEQANFSAQLPAFGVLYYSASSDGFYSSWGERRFKQDAMRGDPSKWSESRWEPWNATEDVTLKRKGTLIPMFAKRIGIMELPNEGKGTGYDLKIGDWVEPYGKGKQADINFAATGDIASGSFLLRWTFSKIGDGIHVVLPDEGTRSELRSPREAPLDGYAPGLNVNWECRVASANGRLGERPICLLFRVRTVVDENGNIISAHYGKIYPEQGNVVFYMNPTPLSRNLEFDPARNLFGMSPDGQRINDY